MNSQSQPNSNASSIIAELERLNMADSCLVDVVNDIHGGPANIAAAKLARLWNWPRILETLLFGLKLDPKDYAKLQIAYVDHGLSKAFFAALDQAIVATNAYRESGLKNDTRYQPLSERFHRVLNSASQNYPDATLSDSEIAMLELDFLSSDDHDETLLRETLVSKLKSQTPKLTR